MLLQPTSPLRTNVHINQAIKLFMSDDHTDSLVSVVEIPHNFTADKQMTYDGVYLSVERNIKRRQDVATRYARNGAAIYMTKYERVHEYILGGNILPFFMSKLESFDIDDMDDWIIVDGLLRCAE